MSAKNLEFVYRDDVPTCPLIQGPCYGQACMFLLKSDDDTGTCAINRMIMDIGRIADVLELEGRDGD